MFCVRRFCPSSPVKNAARTRAGELVARGPVRESQHPSPLAEHHDLARLRERELADELAQLQQLRGREAPERGLRGPLDPREVRPHVLEAELRQAVGDDPLGGEERHQAQELGLGQRTLAGALQELRDRHVERVVLFHLLGGHLDGNPGIRPRRQIGQHLGADAPDHAAGETGPQRVEVPGAPDLRLPVHRRGVPRRQAPFRLQRQVVHPLHDRRELVEPVLHRRARQDEPVRGIQSLHGARGLGRPVLDPLGLVEHDDVRGPVANHVEVANELLVVAQEESPAARVECGAALGGTAVDDRRRGIREELPLAKPLGLERGGDHEQPTADAAGPPEGVAGGDGLRGLAEAHVIGEEKPPAHEEPLDALALVRIERLLEAPQRFAQASEASRALELASKAPAIFLE